MSDHPAHCGAQYRRAFEAEMAAVMAAAHPNVVRMLGVCEHEGRLLLVMERADGRCAASRHPPPRTGLIMIVSANAARRTCLTRGWAR
jgi:hypothetical protein